MKPIEMIMQGFGPFGGIERVDFSRFHGLFLICGDTGAGKTTIFDGISYALFGETSGSARQVDSVRSHYAGEQEPTKVVLTFSQRGRIYTIERSPAYERPKKSGKGMTKETPKVILTMPDGSVLSGANVVAPEIEALLGVDYKQFKQVAMIAQGEFRQLLLVGTEQRGAILRKVFHTERCQYLQEQLKAAASLLRGEAQEAQKQIGSLLGLLQPPDGEEISEEERQDLYKAERKLPQWEAWIYADQSQKERLETEEEQDSAKRSQVRIWQEARHRLEEAVTQRGICLERIEKFQAEASAAQQILQEAEGREEEIQAYSRQAEQVKGQLQARKEAIRLETVLAQKEAEVRKLQHRQEQISHGYGETQEMYRRTEQERAALEDAADLLTQAKSDLDRLKGQQERVWQAERARKECVQLEQSLRAQQEKYRRSEETFAKAQEAYEEAERRWRQNEAGLLAETLIEGEPCPVCGSRSHPAKAQRCGTILNEAQRTALKEEAQRLQQVCVWESSQAANLRGRWETSQTHLMRMQKELPENMDMLNPMILQAQARLRLYRDQRAEYQRLQKFLEEQSRQMELLLQEQNQAAEALQKCQQEKAVCQGAYEQVLARAGTSSEADLTTQLHSLFQKEKEIRERLRQARQTYDLRRQELEKERGLLEGIQERIQKERESLSNVPEKGALLELEAELTERQQARRKQMQETAARLHANRLALQQLRKVFEIYHGVGQRYERMNILAQTAGGNLSGRPKLAFEQYIQAFYFERVLQAANQRLQILSQGQYTLLRREQADNMKKAFGLDMEVLDHYTGRRRPASSLSGGESFQAALALALGLSDVIQRFAGGIEMDAVFIDEGFGSLDHHALEQALTTLATLSVGDRLVGIISHVDALKERVPQQLQVSKSIYGSHIHQKS
ncbi:MAG: AAA family ATPase [Lachnospirales bacterium]